MNKKIQYTSFIVFLAIFIACNTNYVNDRASLISYINDVENGLKKTVQTEHFTYSVTYRPSDLIIEQELQRSPDLNRDSIANQYSECLFFTLALSQDSMEIFGRQNPDFNRLLQTISFELNNNIYITSNNEKYYLKDFIAPRLYGSAPNTSALLCFKDKQLTGNKNISLYIKDFLNNSPEEFEFSFSKNDINKVPKLKIK